MPRKDVHNATTSWLSIGDAVKRYTDKCADAIERGQFEIAESYHRRSVDEISARLKASAEFLNISESLIDYDDDGESK